MTHKDEIIRWAKCPDGTKVWRKDKLDGEWQNFKAFEWRPDHIYIIDDEWAELRKAQIDGKQLQVKSKYECKWIDVELSSYDINHSDPKYWRIKSEPVYEYQWIPKDKEPVWCWNNEDKARRFLRFWNTKYGCTYRYNGARHGASYHHYARVEHIEEWMIEVQKKLED